VESLTLRDESSLGYFLRRVQLPKLIRLVVQCSNLPYKAFPYFLKNHKDTLELIACDNANLLAGFVSGPDADLYAGHPTWFHILEIMLKIPQLSELDLSFLCGGRRRECSFRTHHSQRMEGVVSHEWLMY
jgi:hypothetical protein